MRNKRRAAFPLSLLVLAVYILIFPLSTGNELVFEPGWSLDIRAAGSTQRVQEPLYWYRMGEEFGFVDLHGNIAVREKILFDVTLNDDAYINFSRIPKNLVIRDNRGDFLRSFRLTGYPILDDRGQRIFLMNSGI
jgi:hypothetical protein